MEKNLIFEQRIITHLETLLNKTGCNREDVYYVGDIPEFFKKCNINLNFHKKLFCDEKENDILPKIESNVSGIILFNFSSAPSIEKELKILQKFCETKNCPLIICIPNLSYDEIVFNLLSGKMTLSEDEFPFVLPQITASKIQELMEVSNFLMNNSEDFYLDNPNQFFQKQNPLVEKGTLINNYLTYIKNMVDPLGNVFYMIREYFPIKEKQVLFSEATNSPFLTVVTRTQGTRIDELREVLLCLTAQKNDDFELLIIGHKVKSENEEKVLELIEDTPSSLRSRIRYIPVDYGNRSTPLNVGFANAKGRYISILDDDDIVMDNWVETFYNLEKKHPQKLLHSYSVSQHWKKNSLPGGLAAVDQPDSQFSKDFDYIRQLCVNSCPLLSLSFPASIYNTLGIKFNESLDTTEDWDVIMQVAGITGVCDKDTVTSVYRLWTNAESSQSLHAEYQWHENEAYIRRKLNRSPLLLPEGSAQELTNMVIQKDLLLPEKGYLYFSDDFKFNSKDSEKLSNKACFPNFHYEYLPSNLEERLAQNFRFDPIEQSGISVKDLEISLITEDNTRIFLTNITSNGYFIENEFVFLKADPQLYFNVPSNIKVQKIIIKGRVTVQIDDEIFSKTQRLPMPKDTLFFSDGNEFTYENSKTSFNQGNAPHFRYCYDISGLRPTVQKYRFDPIEQNGVMVQNINFQVTYDYVNWESFAVKNLTSNGYFIENKFVFPKSDPQIYFSIPNELNVKKIMISGEIVSKIPDMIFDQILIKRSK